MLVRPHPLEARLMHGGRGEGGGEEYRTDNLLIPLICQPYHAIPHMPTELWPVLGQTLHVTDSAAACTEKEETW